MLREGKLHHAGIGPGEAAALERLVDRRGVGAAEGADRDLHALEVLEALEAPAVDKVLAHQEAGESVARPHRALVGDRAQRNVALDRIVEPDRDRAGTDIELAAAKRPDHLR